MQVPVRNHMYKNGRIQVICIFYDRNAGLSTHKTNFLVYYMRIVFDTSNKNNIVWKRIEECRQHVIPVPITVTMKNMSAISVIWIWMKMNWFGFCQTAIISVRITGTAMNMQ